VDELLAEAEEEEAAAAGGGGEWRQELVLIGAGERALPTQCAKGPAHALQPAGCGGALWRR
jgi:hypothetical protein